MTDSGFSDYRSSLLAVLAAEDRLPGPAFRTLSEVVEEHGLAEPEAGWLLRAAGEFCDEGLIHLEDHALTVAPGAPVTYALTLLGLEQAGVMR